MEKLKEISVLTWIFFASKGITDNSDLMRCQMLVMECRKDGVTTEMVRNSTGYLSCINDIPSSFLTNEYIQSIIDYKH